MWGAKPSTRLLPKQCLQSYDDGDRAAGAAQNVLDLGTKVQTALSRPYLHAHYQQVEIAALGGQQDCVFGLLPEAARASTSMLDCWPKARISLVIGCVLTPPPGKR